MTDTQAQRIRFRHLVHRVWPGLVMIGAIAGSITYLERLGPSAIWTTATMTSVSDALNELAEAPGGDWHQGVGPALVAMTSAAFALNAWNVNHRVQRHDPSGLHSGNLWTRAPRFAVVVLVVGAIGVLLCLPIVPLHGLVPLWITSCVIAGFALFARAFISRRSLDQETDEGTTPPRAISLAGEPPALDAPAGAGKNGERSGWEIAFLFAGAVIAVLIILAQWWWATVVQANLWWRAALMADPSIWLDNFYSSPRIENSSLSFAINFVLVVAPVFPLIGVIGAVSVLSADRLRVGPFWSVDEAWIRRVLVLGFATAVVGIDGDVVGVAFPLAFLLSLPLARAALRDDLTLVSTRTNEYHRAQHAKQSRTRLVAHRKELFLRAAELEDSTRRLNALRDQGTGSHRDIDSGSSGDVHRSEQEALPADMSLLPLLTDVKPSLRQLVFAVGPCGNGWDNGVLAAKLGALLSLAPLGFFVYVLLTRRGDELIGSGDQFGGIELLVATAIEVSFWIGAAFVLGALYSLLRGVNGMAKGAVLTGLYAAAQAAAWLVVGGEISAWSVRSVQLLLFLMILGLLLDAKAWVMHGFALREFIDFYRLRHVRPLLVRLSPLVVTSVAVGQQLYSGRAQDAIVSIARALPEVLP